MRWTLPLCLLLAACPKPIPEHLRVAPQPSVTEAAKELQTLEDVVAAFTATDPLSRAPTLPPAGAMATVEGAEGVRAFMAAVRSVERRESGAANVLQQVEDRFPTSAAVAMARGYRLRAIENRLTKLQNPNEPIEREVLDLLTPLQVADGVEGLPKRPLQWLAPNRELPRSLRDYGDRWVLGGWLVAPDIPLGPVAKAMGGAPYDGLRETPLGALVLARGKGATGPDTAFADLERATSMALERAAADRDVEQAAWSDRKKAAAKELGVDNPEAALLERARVGLTAAAGSDRAAGGALLAIAAARWHNTCPDKPCVGLDRVQLMRTAMGWDPDVERLARIWQVIALKESLDTLEAGRESVMFPRAMVDLIDVLLGTGAGPLDSHLVRRKAPDPAVWLDLGRAAGTDGTTDWEGARAALGAHLEHQAELARAQTSDDSKTATLLDRILRRAIP